MNSIKNIIFDLGGVLITLDLGATEEAFRKLIGPTSFSRAYKQLQNEGIFEKIETAEISAAEFIQKIQEQTVPTASKETIQSAWNAMLKTIPIKGIQLIDSLREQGFRLYVLSNTNSIHLEAFRKIAFKEHGIKDFDALFDKVYYSHLVQKRKPNTSIFEHVLQNAGLKANETLFIDDNEPNLIGARKTGLNTLLHNQDNCIYRHLTQFLKLA